MSQAVRRSAVGKEGHECFSIRLLRISGATLCSLDAGGGHWVKIEVLLGARWPPQSLGIEHQYRMASCPSSPTEGLGGSLFPTMF